MNKDPELPKDPAQRPPRKGIQSLVTGFQVIDFLMRVGKPVPLKDIAAGAGLSPSKLQFYLISLMEVGVVNQDSRSGHYGLGPYTLRLGIAGLQQFDIFDAARAPLDQIAERHGHNVFLGVWGNHGPTIVHRVGGHSSRSLLELRLGSVLPVLRSALGRLFLSYLPDPLTAPYVERELSEITPGSAGGDPEMPQTLQEVRELRDTIQARQMSRSRGGLLSDHTALSAPVFDYRGKIIAGVTVMGPIQLLDDAFDSPVANDLAAITAAISQEAGQTTRHYLDF